MSEKKILLIEQKPVPRRVVQIISAGEYAILAVADDGTMWRADDIYSDWKRLQPLPDRTVEELRDG